MTCPRDLAKLCSQATSHPICKAVPGPRVWQSGACLELHAQPKHRDLDEDVLCNAKGAHYNKETPLVDDFGAAKLW